MLGWQWINVSNTRNSCKISLDHFEAQSGFKRSHLEYLQKRRLSYKILENEYTVYIMYPQAIGDEISCCEPWRFYQIGDPFLSPRKIITTAGGTHKSESI
jgi:hypothetical protein